MFHGFDDQLKTFVSPAVFCNMLNLLSLGFSLNLTEIESERVEMQSKLIVADAAVEVLVHSFH